MEGDECRTCGGTVRPRYICGYCNHGISSDEISEDYTCPYCDRPIPKEVVDSGYFDKASESAEGSFDKVTIKGDEMTIQMEDNEIVSLEGVEEVSLNTSDENIARVVNPDFAEFSTVEKYERSGDDVELYFQGRMRFRAEEKKEILDKIKEVSWFKE